VRSTTFLFTTLFTSIQVFGDFCARTGVPWNVFEPTARCATTSCALPPRRPGRARAFPRRPRLPQAAHAPRRVGIRPCRTSRRTVAVACLGPPVCPPSSDRAHTEVPRRSTGYLQARESPIKEAVALPSRSTLAHAPSVRHGLP
jgi:hypothetical protein